MYRYFSQDLNGEKPILCDEDIHHIFHVLRLNKGEKFEIVCRGLIYDCEIINDKVFDYKYISSRKLVDNKYKTTLMLAFSKSDKLELVLQKCTEIGADHFLIYQSERSVAKIDKQSFIKKSERYRKIIREASMQSKRNDIPSIDFIDDVNTMDWAPYDGKFIAYEKSDSRLTNNFKLIKSKMNSIFVVGPEGGFSDDEIAFFEEKQFIFISLGKNILRCETAPIYISSVVSYLIGEDYE